MMICDNEYIHIIDLPDAQNNILANILFKDEIDVVRSVFAVAYLPINGAVILNGFREEGQFKAGLVFLIFSNCETVYSIPLHFQCLQGFTPNEEIHFTLYIPNFTP